MERTWMFTISYLIALSFLQLCNGLPIELERTAAGSELQLISIVLALFLMVCTLFLLAGCLCCKRAKGFTEFRNNAVTVSAAGGIENGLVNPSADGAFTIFSPLSRQNIFTSNERLRIEEDYTYDGVNVSSWFDEGEIDFPRSKLKYIRELGEGWFGKVVEGTALDLEKSNAWTSVVVRILNSTASTKERVFFLHEAEIYRQGEHANILKLHGRCLDSVSFLLLQEYCPQGDLRTYLLANRTNADNLLSSEYPLIWCCQITSAVKFLHEKGVAHPDLACRNCQLTSNLTLKLGDYGLAPSKYADDYYQGIRTISVRWCAPESITHTNTTIQSERITREANVWSLAVCFWEICECGDRPYKTMNDDDVVTRVLGKENVRLSRPSQGVLYTDYIYNLMNSCWSTPESRPTAAQIYLTLTDLLQVFTVCKEENRDSMTTSRESQESFDLRWNSLKPNNRDDRLIASLGVQPKPLSPSLNNLIGSLENIKRSRNFEEDNPLLTGSSPSNIAQPDSLNDSMIYGRRSSSSETEEENWKMKIERGAYTEKVRQKSQSVTDLMVLTHIDYSESESETPQPSLDHKVNHKSVRFSRKGSQVYGSEGNLLRVEGNFEEELRKLQEEQQRDSLFFVPDKFSQNLNTTKTENVDHAIDDDDIQSVNRVFNVFNVTVDNSFSPVHMAKLKEIIDLEEPITKSYKQCEVPKMNDINIIHLENKEYIVPNHTEVLETTNSVEVDILVTSESNEVPETLLIDNEKDKEIIVMIDKESQTSQNAYEQVKNSCQTTELYQVPKLIHLIENNDTLMDYIIANYESELHDDLSLENAFKDTVPSKSDPNSDVNAQDNPSSSTYPVVDFDLSDSQDASNPNSLTHVNIFRTGRPRSNEIATSFNRPTEHLDDPNLDYSLETWDNFLQTAMNLSGGSDQDEVFFASVNSEPKSTIFQTGCVEDDEDLSSLQDRPFPVEEQEVEHDLNETYVKNESEVWESSGGWFLHPQCNDHVTGKITTTEDVNVSNGCDVGDEILAELRGELLAKLPHAQGSPSSRIQDDDDDWQESEKDEVLLRYNFYNTPLSPIKEESEYEDDDNDVDDTSNLSSQSSTSSTSDDWLEKFFVDVNEVDKSLPPKPQLTLSQDSCCSNDTLFNLEDMTSCVAVEQDKQQVIQDKVVNSEDKLKTEAINYFKLNVELDSPMHDVESPMEPIDDKSYLSDFLTKEREHSEETVTHIEPVSRSKHVAPLPSPDDHPWKELSASLLNYERLTKTLETPDQKTITPDYENVKQLNEDDDDTLNEADYVEIENLENSRNIKPVDRDNFSPDYVNTSDNKEDEIFAVLTDIRFSGPGESHLMSTSFSESNELNNDRDWDSGSDTTRSSSSGEFIWKEGEHEESLKALQALPQDPTEGGQLDKNGHDGSSSSSCSDEEGECPEFIPSAWDKYATPAKSALRSPEKTLEKEEKKKGVWFKKQRYHCVYEYPREPESPILQSYDLWNNPPPVTSYPEWYFDIDSGSDFNDFPAVPRSTSSMQFHGSDFFVTSSATPFDVLTSSSSSVTASQFFPGDENWTKLNDNTTPDSGVEDVTPAEGCDYKFQSNVVLTLKMLAEAAYEKSRRRENTNGRSEAVLGGLRHTRDKLKLDLPPSPNTFTSTKSFNLDAGSVEPPATLREKPTFVTFGKSRFSVQQVETPDKDSKGRNVCFDALPYKPYVDKKKIEKGEASLLDSTDEDSGIESSTLERKLGKITANL